MAHQGVRIGTVRAVPRSRCGARFRSESDQRIAAEDVDLCKSSPDGTPRNGALHRPQKRIIAASIEDDQSETLCRFNELDDAIKRDGLIFHIKIALKDSIHRYQIVDAIHLDAVPSVVDDCNVGVANLI